MALNMSVRLSRKFRHWGYDMRRTDTQIQVRVSSADKEKIMDRMKKAGITNLTAYMKKMAIDGYIILLDMSDVKDVLELLHVNGLVLGELLERAEASETISHDDIVLLQEQQDEIWKTMQQILIRLSNIS